MAREKSMMEKSRDWRLDESIPRYFRGYIDNIDNNLERLDKNVKLLIKDLGKDGLTKESNDLSNLYKKHLIEFNVKFQQFKRRNK